ncbi:MAG TPA: TolC family protein, partial [Polyangiaceae bacterium]|nr:TolC family protein [Polyangiaceae bacterium]
MFGRWLTRALGALAGVMICVGSAQGQMTDPCTARVTRATVVSCALRASPEVYGERAGLEGLEGRQTAAGVRLPSNPSLGLTLGRRQTAAGAAEASGTTWGASLSQELEIAGQRGARLDEVGAEQRAQRQRIVAMQREAASAALAAYFDALAAKEERALTEHLANLARSLANLARGRADAGLGSAVEGELADAASVRLLQAQFTAERRVRTTAATLATLLGQDPTRGQVQVEGELAPLPVADAEPEALAGLALARRAEVAVAEAEREAQERRASVLRRSRIPNPTLSIFAQSDRADERVFGVGLSLPIPLPAPLGRTYAGEIAETEALAKRAGSEAVRVRRAVLLELATSAAAVTSRKQELALFDAARLARAEQALAAIAQELDARRLSVRDALLAQQTLVELLQANIEARRQLCLASAELARAAGIALEDSPLPPFS